MTTVGIIRIDKVDEHYRLTIDTKAPYLDDLEATGETVAEALENLLELVEAYE